MSISKNETVIGSAGVGITVGAENEVTADPGVDVAAGAGVEVIGTDVETGTGVRVEVGVKVGVGVEVGVGVIVGVDVGVLVGVGVGVRVGVAVGAGPQAEVSKLQAISQLKVPGPKPILSQVSPFKSLPSQSSPPSTISFPQILILTVASRLEKYCAIAKGKKNLKEENTKKITAKSSINFLIHFFTQIRSYPVNFLTLFVN